MDATHQVATISALEAATDALMVALGRRPDPDLEAATAALKAREAALRFLVRTDPKTRPPDLNARLRRILDRDREAADQLRTEMASLRERLANTRRMMNTTRDPSRSTGAGRSPSGSAPQVRGRTRLVDCRSPAQACETCADTPNGRSGARGWPWRFRETRMSTIQFGGVISGLNTQSIIDALVAAEKQPLTDLQTKEATLTSAEDGIRAARHGHRRRRDARSRTSPSRAPARAAAPPRPTARS